MARMVGLALSIAFLAGCQNNSERDLIARDRRMQEDQIYALQDYITQYQRLLCQYRSENASLKRQLSEDSSVEPQMAEPQLMPRPRSGIPSTTKTPQFQTPTPPGVKQQQVSPPRTPPKMETPEVPPLESTTTDDSSTTESLLGEATEQHELAPRVLKASYDEPVRQSATTAAIPRANRGTTHTTGVTSDVMLSGEVVVNSTGGPRLMIDVVPFGAAAHVQPFEGSVSLMLLVDDDHGKRRSLGRWDYGPDDVRSAIRPTDSRSTMRFFIELPAGTPTSEASQLWVRLIARDGTKLLAHTNVNLARHGKFSSRTNKNWPSEEAFVSTSYEEEESTSANSLGATTNEGTWAVAEPGKPANLPVEARDKSGAGGWRVATEPMPKVVATSTEPTSSMPKKAPSRHIHSPLKTATKEPSVRPGWAPERSGTAASNAATRPSWSATR